MMRCRRQRQTCKVGAPTPHVHRGHRAALRVLGDTNSHALGPAARLHLGLSWPVQTCGVHHSADQHDHASRTCLYWETHQLNDCACIAFICILALHLGPSWPTPAVGNRCFPRYQAVYQTFGGLKAKWPNLTTMAVLDWETMPLVKKQSNQQKEQASG